MSAFYTGRRITSTTWNFIVNSIPVEVDHKNGGDRRGFRQWQGGISVRSQWISTDNGVKGFRLWPQIRMEQWKTGEYLEKGDKERYAGMTDKFLFLICLKEK